MRNFPINTNTMHMHTRQNIFTRNILEQDVSESLSRSKTSSGKSPRSISGNDARSTSDDGTPLRDEHMLQATPGPHLSPQNTARGGTFDFTFGDDA